MTISDMITVDDMSNIDTTTSMDFSSTYDWNDSNFTTVDYENVSAIKYGNSLNHTMDQKLHDHITRWMIETYCAKQYCSGHIKDVITNYNNVHGYISLLVIEFGLRIERDWLTQLSKGSKRIYIPTM